MTNTRSRQIPWKRLAGEFVVIFAGVTLSLAADDWNSRRQDRVAEQSILSELTEDLAADSADMASVLAQMERHDRSALWLLQRWNDPATDADSISRHFRSLAFYTMYQPVRATYTGLRDAGRLTLIQDDATRREVIRYYEMRQPYILQFTDPYAGAAYAPLRSATAPYLQRSIDESATSLRGGSIDLELIQPWSQITADPILRHRIHELGTYAATAALRMRDVVAENSDLRSLLAEAITP